MRISGSKLDSVTLQRHYLAQMPISPRFTPNVSRVIDVLTYPSVQVLDVTGPLQVFASPTWWSTRLPVKRIAQRCGFGSEETMRRGFLRLLTITPQDHRARFGREAGGCPSALG